MYLTKRQMAEGWAQALKGNIIEPHSAGIDPHGMNARAIKVMAEAGVDISKHTSKHVDDVMYFNFDYVVTVCGHADESCPVFPGKTWVVHVAGSGCRLPGSSDTKVLISSRTRR